MLRPKFSPKKVIFFTVLILFASGNTSYTKFKNLKKSQAPVNSTLSLYDTLQLSDIGLKETVFKQALAGWDQLKKSGQLERPDLLSIADLSQSSNSKRLYVIDMEKKIVLFNTYVSHGRNSGEEFACSFGNKQESYKSSLGFYLTGSSYSGTHGLSMKLIGLEKGINHFAEQRGIVMHGASYVSESFIRKYGRLGRSQGCPAVPEEDCQPIVSRIKEGSLFFIFYPDSNYFNCSSFYN